MADIPGGPKKETIYNGPSVPMPMNGSYGTATAVQPKKETIYNGPVPGATVYDPVRNGAPKPAAKAVADPERMKKAGNIFFLIAGFSLVNTVLAMMGVNLAMAIGLGITRVFDAELRKGGSIGPVLVINLLVAAVFVVLGMVARNGVGIVFLFGMLLYGADTVLLAQDGFDRHIPSIVIHIIFILSMFRGYKMTRES